MSWYVFVQSILKLVIDYFCQLIAGIFGVFGPQHVNFTTFEFSKWFSEYYASSLLIQGVIVINVWNGLNRLEIHVNWISSSSFKHCRTKKVDAFTSGLLDIHSKMLEINKKEVSISFRHLNLSCSLWFV